MANCSAAAARSAWRSIVWAWPRALKQAASAPFVVLVGHALAARRKAGDEVPGQSVLDERCTSTDADDAVGGGKNGSLRRTGFGRSLRSTGKHLAPGGGGQRLVGSCDWGQPGPRIVPAQRAEPLIELAHGRFGLLLQPGDGPLAAS